MLVTGTLDAVVMDVSGRRRLQGRKAFSPNPPVTAPMKNCGGSTTKKTETHRNGTRRMHA
jgi:hypothetical protein